MVMAGSGLAYLSLCFHGAQVPGVQVGHAIAVVGHLDSSILPPTNWSVFHSLPQLLGYSIFQNQGTPPCLGGALSFLVLSGLALCGILMILNIYFFQSI